MNPSFKLIEFNVYTDNSVDVDADEQEEQHFYKRDSGTFTIQMFGLNELGESASITVDDYKPFFYVKVGEYWTDKMLSMFVTHIKKTIKPYYEASIESYKFVNKRKLYGFDANALYKFVKITFKNITVYNKVKNLWYVNITNYNGEPERILKKNGYEYRQTNIELYEANIPPLLRAFHIKDICPSGWIELPYKYAKNIADINKKTTCKYEYLINYEHIMPLNDKETSVPYNIMSFDIEASSSHGDFPVPVKSYKKLATNISDYFDKNCKNIEHTDCIKVLKNIINCAFGYSSLYKTIDLVYPKTNISNISELTTMTDNWLNTEICKNVCKTNSVRSIECLFENMNKQNATEKEQDNDEEQDEDINDNEENEEKNEHQDDEQYQDEYIVKPNHHIQTLTHSSNVNIVNIMCDRNMSRENIINELIISLAEHFPELEGDKVTFIGSTFKKHGEKEPHLNICLVLKECNDIPTKYTKIEIYDTECELLIGWKNLVQKENPDIIIGYNIFGFDYQFIFRRSQELNCAEEFLELSRNKHEMCGTICRDTKILEIEKSNITIASGTFDLSYIKMNGRLQVDMLNWFRRTSNLESYKLDSVATEILGDTVKSLEHIIENNQQITRINTSNMSGLQLESYIRFDEINHSTNKYKNGETFKIINLNIQMKYFDIIGHEYPSAKTIKWGLAKDDVSPKDIFRMTNEGPASKAIIAKYCIQDCNLVHYLFDKVDVMTDLIEMSRLCSVPMTFLLLRGQGIKLTSYMSKKCREHNVLMPTISRGDKNDGYEGAIVLDPKCGLYLDKPNAVGDFGSLYPSSMISENLCPSSKVWAKCYDLLNKLVSEEGEKNSDGQFKYDNLENYEYVDIKFDTYKYVRKSLKGKFEKVRSGYKMCRFAQNVDGTMAIVPSILSELIIKRTQTRKLMALQTDSFNKNKFNARQMCIKLLANSVYGQLGAKTSTFYDPDIAASTTSTGRLLLTYAKRIIEECYQDTLMTSSQGIVRTKAEYTYGDTDSVFFNINLTNLDTNEAISGQPLLELTIELAKKITHTVSKFLKKPHDFEYEKTFLPFCLLSKKRYVGILYENDPTKGKRKEMGIVLKRRDNAPIVKDIYGGVIDILMNERNINSAIEFIKNKLECLVNKQIPNDRLIISKSLRSFYKKPGQIAHKVLADRITEREPGNKPTSGDRIAYMYIINANKKALQGQKIETPIFIQEQNLQIDYSFYITNQIMKPMVQLLGLVLEDIWKSQEKTIKLNKFIREVEQLKKTITDIKKLEKKTNDLRYKEINLLLFEPFLREINNATNKAKPITKFFKKT